MGYTEIKAEIVDISTTLLSTVSAKEHDYTHQPDKWNVIENINRTIAELTELKLKIIRDDD